MLSRGSMPLFPIREGVPRVLGRTQTLDLIPHTIWTTVRNFCWHPLAADVESSFLLPRFFCVSFILPSPQPAEANCLSKQSYIDAIQIPKLAVGYRIGVPTSLMLSLLEFLPFRHRRLRHC